ncbi:hypothetical protein FQN50_001287 [Emmonsiellopsis sp. PD_5]|nr:hypothetical protein FQN50_001287 [Emmonsiellopsis sp. PD_5]
MAPNTEIPDIPSYSRFACIGTGLSAIALGATLKRWYGIEDIRFFDRHATSGGTWYINSYPGCACDVPSALYSFSFALNPKWTRLMPSNKEIKEYHDQVLDDYSLESRMTFSTEVTRCIWREDASRWLIYLHDLKTGRRYTHECQILFSASGQLVKPRPCDIPGAETFNGDIFHSARWNHSVDLEGKNVVVLGNGCTATQIVPAIVGKVKSLTQVVRTQHWVFPAINFEYTPVMHWIFQNIPFAMRLHRLLIFSVAESDFRLFPMSKSAARLRAKRRVKVEKYMRDTAPAKYHDILIPDFDVGCKRRIFDSGYLKSLHSDKIHLTDAKIQGIVPEGLKTDKGVIPADVIALATGFHTNEFLPYMEIIGRDGVSVSEHWSQFGGPSAYNCSVMNGFPNFFILLGPNSATGHTSALMAAENTVNYALRVLKPLLDGEAEAMEVKKSAERDYVYWMQDALRKRVWNAGCISKVAKTSKPSNPWRRTIQIILLAGLVGGVYVIGASKNAGLEYGRKYAVDILEKIWRSYPSTEQKTRPALKCLHSEQNHLLIWFVRNAAQEQQRLEATDSPPENRISMRVMQGKEDTLRWSKASLTDNTRTASQDEYIRALHDRIRELEETRSRGGLTGPIFNSEHARESSAMTGSPGGSRQAILNQTVVTEPVLNNEREVQQDLCTSSGPAQAENESPRRNAAFRADNTISQTAVPPSVNDVRMADDSPGDTSGAQLYNASSRVTGMGQISGPEARLDPQSPPQEFYGASSTASFMRLARASMPFNQPHKAISDQSISSGQVTYQLHEPATQFGFEDFALPPRSLADNLLQCFWDRVYCLYPFFDRPSFEAAYENLWRSDKEPLNKLSESNIGLGGRFDSGPKSIVFHSALNAMFALGCHFADIPREEREVTASLFFRRNTRFIGVDLLEVNTIGVVQVFLLAALYLQSSPFPSRCWNAIGIACRVGLGLGLHEPNNPYPLTPLENDIRRRTWHGCGIMDIVASMTYGRPSMTSHLASVPLPDTAGERQTPSLMTFYSATIRLYKILDDILSDVYNVWRAGPRQEHSSSRSQGSFDTLIELERRLCTYESDLPPFLNWTAPSPPEHPPTDQSTTLERQRNVLHGRYNYLRLLLYRPIFIQLCSEANNSNASSRNAAQEPHPDTSSEGKLTESVLYSCMANKCAAACVLAAVDLIQLVHDTYLTTTTDAWWYNGFYTSTAATVLIMSYSVPHILHSTQSHTTIVEESWSKCETILSHMATFSKSARNTLQFLQAAHSSQLDPSGGRGGAERERERDTQSIDAGNGNGGGNQIQERERPFSPSQASPEEPATVAAAAQHHHPPHASASASVYEAATILSPPISHQDNYQPFQPHSQPHPHPNPNLHPPNTYPYPYHPLDEFSAGVAAAAAAAGQGAGGPFGPLVTEELGFLSWMDTQDMPGWIMGDFKGAGSGYG